MNGRIDTFVGIRNPIDKLYKTTKKINLILIILLMMITFNCCSLGPQVENGTRFWDVKGRISVCTSISVGKKNNKTSKPVLFTFNYGHDYGNNAFNDETLLGHRLEVFIYDGRTGIDNFGEQIFDNYQSLYEINFSGREFLKNEYKIKNRGTNQRWLWSKIRYNRGFTLSIDFNNVNIDEGVIVIRLSEIFLSSDLIDEEVVKTRFVGHGYTCLRFKKQDSKVIFTT